MNRTRIRVSKEILRNVLMLPRDVSVEDVSSNPDHLDEVVFMLCGNVPDTPWSTVIVHKENVRLEFVKVDTTP